MKKNVNKEQGFSSLDQIKGLHCLRERKFVVCIFVVCQSVTVMDVAWFSDSFEFPADIIHFYVEILLHTASYWNVLFCKTNIL